MSDTVVYTPSQHNRKARDAVKLGRTYLSFRDGKVRTEFKFHCSMSVANGKGERVPVMTRSDGAIVIPGEGSQFVECES